MHERLDKIDRLINQIGISDKQTLLSTLKHNDPHTLLEREQ